MSARTGACALVVVLFLLGACHDPGATPLADGGVSDAAVTPDGRAETEADRLLGADRDRFFDELVTTIGGVQVVSTAGLARLGTTWDEALTASRRRFAEAKTALDVYYALLSLQRSYHDGHSWLHVAPGTLPTGERTPPVALPLRLRVEYAAGSGGTARYVVTSVGAAASATVAVGSRLEALDGRAVAALEAERREWHPTSSPEGLREGLARWLTWRWAGEGPAPAPQTAARLRLVPPGGGATEVTLRWQEADDAPSSDPCLAGMPPRPGSAGAYAARAPEFVGINYCIYDAGVAQTKILRWFSFFYEFSDVSGGDPSLAGRPALRGRLAHTSYAIADGRLPRTPGGQLDGAALAQIDLGEALTYLQAQGAGRLLIDVRENGGGNFHPAWLAPFASKPFAQLATEVRYGAGLRADPTLLDGALGPHALRAKDYLLKNPSATTSPAYPFICLSAQCGAADLSVAPASSPWAGEVVILTGPGCFSSCDNFVAMMKDSGLAKLAGTPPAGADSPLRLPLTAPLKNGARVTFVLSVAVNRRENGEILEGGPPLLDHPVYPTGATRGRYLEVVLSTIGWN